MQIKLAGLSQETSFDDNSVTNFVTLVLPNGVPIKAIVSDGGVEKIIEARGGAPALAPVAQAPSPTTMPTSPEPEDSEEEYDEESGAVVFGGATDQDESSVFMPGGPPQILSEAPAAASKPAPIVPMDVQQQTRLYQEEQKRLRKNAQRGPTSVRTVPKDAAGNPMPSGGGGMNVEDVLGGGGGGADADEDGVAQG